MIYVVDAHALLWHLDDNPLLGREAGRILDDPRARLIAPSIVLAELLWALRKQRITEIWQEVLDRIDSDLWLNVYPLTVDVLRVLPTGLEMHDAIVCATAGLLTEAGEDVAVITRDREICESGLVQTIW